MHADQYINLLWLVRLDLKMYRFSSLMVTVDIGRCSLRDPCDLRFVLCHVRLAEVVSFLTWSL